MFVNEFFKSFVFALRGIRDGFKSEPNLRIHFLAGLVAITLGFIFKISTVEWAIIALTIFLVITLELINTVLEKTIDMVSPQITEKARVVKDMSAAVVLLGALASVVIAILIFAF